MNGLKTTSGLALLACLLTSSVVAEASESKPNIILIMTDDQGYDDYGFRQAPMQTPNMDRMAMKGVRFDRFYTAPACAPTRSALMTGRNYLKTGTSAVGFGAEGPHMDEYLLGEAMQDAGYATGMVGKWNLGLSDAELPSRRGFDEAWPIVQKEVRSYGRYTHFNAPFFHNGRYAGIEDGWQVERVTDKAIRFIESNKGAPFFLYLAYAQPHEPWLCPQEYQQKYIDQGVGPEYAMFMGMMQQLDEQIGRVLDSLETNQIAEDTIVLFLGDNGPTPTTRILEQQADGWFRQTGEYYSLDEQEWARRNPSGFREKKATGWECAVRNRLLVYCPAKYTPRVVTEQRTLVMDIYPTLVEWAGGIRPTYVSDLDGQSLASLIEGQGEWKAQDYFTSEAGKPQSHRNKDNWSYRFTEYTLPLDQRSSCFYSGDYVVVNDGGNWSLYNIIEDPKQRADLQNQMPEKFASMQKLYYSAFDEILSDPHAFSDPVQELNVTDGREGYIEMEGIYRVKGKNSVTWANTYFHELNAMQELKVDVLEAGEYAVTLRALGVPAETRIRFEAGTSVNEVDLVQGKKFHPMGRVRLDAGEQTFAFTLLETADLKGVGKMGLYSLSLKKTN